MAGARIQLKRATAAAWTAANTVLFVGEIGLETDTGKFKIGNGSTAWTSLNYSIVSNLASAVLNDLGDVTITNAQDGDFLRWNGTAFVNDAVDLGTDTIGSFVESLVAGTGITLSNNSGESATPTVAVTANTFDAFGAASTAAGNAATALTNHEADTTNIHGIADTSILVTTTGTQTLTNKTITSPSGLVKGDVGLGNVDNTADTAKPVSTAQQTALDLKAPLASPTFTGTVTVPTPTNSTDAATKAYADTIAAGINWHESVELATATALPNSPTYDNGTSGVGSTLTATSNGRLLVDGVNATTGNRILVKDQATATQNGIYVVTAQGAAGATYLLTRATDHDGAGDNIVRGDAVYVGNGSSNVNQGFLINSVGSSGAKELHVVGTDDITFTQFTGAANINAGTGITKTGNTLAIGQSVATNASVAFTQVTAALVGNASTATTLATARNIAGQSFDGSGNISIAPTDLTGVTSTAAELNILDGATLTVTELNHVDGVTSAIQTQIDLKAPLASPTFTGTVTVPTPVNATDAASKEYVDSGVASAAVATLNDIGDVTITSATTGDFLKWNGTAFVNDPIDLGTDTVGNYVSGVTAGTGITVTHTPSEGSSPTIAVTTNTFDAFGAASTAATNAGTALSNHEADTTNIHGIADTSILLTTTGTQTLTNKTITSPSGLVKGDVGLGSVDNTTDTAKPVSTAQQTALNLKANLASPSLTGTPLAPTATAGTNTTQVATTEFVSTAVANLVDTAPEALNTLDELAAALGDDPSFATTVSNNIGLKAPLASPTFTGTVTIPTGASITAPTGLVKGDVGLSSVNNTADTAKPVSTAQQTALNLKANLASPTFTGTVTLPSGTVTSAMIADGTIANVDISTSAAIDLGKIADVATNAQTASYTLVLADKNKIVEMNVASANNLTIPPNSSVAFPVGSQINILQVGAGQTTVVAGAGVTVNGTPGLKVRTQFSYATCIKRATDTWVLVGDLSA